MQVWAVINTKCLVLSPATETIIFIDTYILLGMSMYVAGIVQLCIFIKEIWIKQLRYLYHKYTIYTNPKSPKTNYKYI